MIEVCEVVSRFIDCWRYRWGGGGDGGGGGVGGGWIEKMMD